MPITEAFILAVPEVFGGAEFAGMAGGAEALGAAGAMDLGAAGGMGAFDAGAGLGGGMFGGAMAPTTGAGITQAALGPATQGVVSGGAGAGAPGVNEAMVNMTQNAGTSAGAGAAQSAAPAMNASMLGATDMSLGQAGAQNMAEAGYGPMGTQSMDMAGATQRAAENVARTPGFGSSSSPFMDNPFMKGVSAVWNWSKENPFPAAGIAYVGAKKLGLFDDDRPTAANRTPDKGIGYSMSPDFQGRFANPQDYQYTPKRYTYAEGGIMQAGGGPVEMMSNANAVGANTGYPMANINKGAYATPYQTPISRNVVTGGADTNVDPMTGEMKFAKGGDLSSALDYYTQMMDQRANPPEGKSAPRGERGDPGIYYDLDPDTRYQDALTAAQIRMAKVNKRANMQVPGMRRPTPMGQINLAPPGVKREASGSSLDPENAARGGIMHSSLGGYAAGGNPRLLKGPGDGMSDDIPATINARQPARLADGEFVVPADVVSHLGNGSTDAGAKKLHEMMTKVRKERTGNPKQGKKINPNKFVPK